MSELSVPPHDVATVVRRLTERLGGLDADLVDLRHDLHRHPELSWAEHRTAGIVAERLAAVGCRVRRVGETGVVADLGTGNGPTIALRADLDALPVQDRTGDPWASVVPGVAHACGHDVHIAGLLGAAQALAGEASALPGTVRFVFQAAEEAMPGGALQAVEAGVLEGVDLIFALHCDPSIDVGAVGLREGPITGAADWLDITLHGRGGHTSRPHLTEDLTFALGMVITSLPAALSRRLDPRAGVSVSWGIVEAGSAVNVIPATGRLAGTVRTLDPDAWRQAEDLVVATVQQVLAPYGVVADINYVRGVPPVVNETAATRILGAGVRAAIGEAALVPTRQSLGGEDFAWYLERIPGAMARLGVRTPGGRTYDLHQGDLRVDDRAVGIAARVLSSSAVHALATLG